ncbi:Ameloblastin [Manis javanica]|nr:Ameloblastin [Manis javanica]
MVEGRTTGELLYPRLGLGKSFNSLWTCDLLPSRSCFPWMRWSKHETQQGKVPDPAEDLQHRVADTSGSLQPLRPPR